LSAVTSRPIPMLAEDDAALEALRFLSDGNRLRILRVLARRESCVCELIEQLGQPQPLISYHLRRLREAGLVRSRRQAQWVYYSIDAEAWQRLTQPIQDFCDAASFPPEAAYGASASCPPTTTGRPGATAPGERTWPED
jgi:ArsR family transcriptional regulator